MRHRTEGETGGLTKLQIDHLFSGNGLREASTTLGVFEPVTSPLHSSSPWRLECSVVEISTFITIE